MTRTTSAAFKDAVFSSETSEAFLVLITVRHDDLVQDINITSDNVDTVSNGTTYSPFPFEITLPDDTPESPPLARIVFDNIDRSIVQAIRSITSAPSVDIRIVLASDPDTYEFEQTGLQLVDVDYDVFTVVGELRGIDVLNAPYPGDRFTPDKFKALF